VTLGEGSQRRDSTLREGLADFVQRVVAGSPTLRHRMNDALALIDVMTAGWGDRAPDGPPHVSYLARDGTPFEPSIRIAKSSPSELRWVLEAQPENAARDASAYFAAALALDERLAARGLIDLEHMRQIADLFATQLPDTTAAIWFGAALGPTGPAVIKNYFVCSNPGQWRVAFSRFGLDALAHELAAHLPAASKVEFVSVDLAGTDPRLKLYVRHRGPLDCDAIDASHRLSPHYRKGDAALLVRALFGGIPVLRKLGPISTFHISRATGNLTHSSLNVPLEPLHYATRVPADDTTIALGIARFVRSLDLPIDPLYAHMLSVALNDGVNYPHHRYAGLQRRGPGDAEAEVTVYLSTLLQACHDGLAYGPVRLGPAPGRS